MSDIFNDQTFKNLNLTTPFKKGEYDTCIFIHCDFSNIDISETHFIDCKFDECEFLNSTFSDANLERVDLRTSHGFIIDPNHNCIKKAKISLYDLPGLLTQYDIEIET
ncbi:MAG: pentapeptide repeat-containing protein [Bacteroidales bacterium]